VPGQSLFGVAALIGIAWVFSENRRSISWKKAGLALIIQLIIASILLNVEALQGVFHALNTIILGLQAATKAGTSLVFGYLGGGELPFTARSPGTTFILAFQGLPVILIISALSALLYHWGILQIIVRCFAWVLRGTLGVTGGAGVGVAANIFVGMVEAPLLIRPYINKISRADLFLIMTAGMATIAGTMMVLYSSIIGPAIPNALGHILTASFINAPGAILIARLLVPAHLHNTKITEPIIASPATRGAIDAVTQGTLDGVKLLFNIIAMLIVMVALVSLANMCLGIFPDVFDAPITLQRILGWIMSPVAWLIGVPWDQAQTAGSLLGIKIVLNELVAYIELAQLENTQLSEKSRIILVYALCGFANLGSLGIMLGGLGTIAQERRSEIAGLGLKSIFAGVLSTLVTASIIALMI
tara:strand:- start:710 stop:1957 length:1248 start_codon:yes stop_codon:yes gene_type:complete